MDKTKTPFSAQKGTNVGKTPRKPPRKNLIKQQSDNVEVFCRIRPLESSNEPACIKRLNQTTVVLSPLESFQTLRNGAAYKELQYTFQNVFDEETSQKTLFECVGLPLMDDLLHGKNGLLFAYGVTSSGKTFTMNGSSQNPGILPRCLDCIFSSIGELQAKKYVFKPDRMNGFDVQSEADALLERQTRDINPKLNGNKQSQPREKYDLSTPQTAMDSFKIEDLEIDNYYAVFVSYVEIYNNYVYDLLEDLPIDPIIGIKPPTSKIIREDCDRNMFVSGVVEMEIMNSDEATDLLLKGQKRRKVAYTALNAESSRSHSVFSIRVVQGPLDPAGEQVIQDKKRLCVSQLSLVDLAGSERCLRTGNAGDRLKEAGNINQSLMVLRSCIEALRENQTTGASKMVPYRDSRLTTLFRTFFDGKGKVRMIVCVNPKASDYDETINVMKFAELTQEVQVARAQPARFDTGLTPGRRLANQQYKDALSKAREDGDETVVSQALVYSLGPPFPSLEVFGANDETSLSTLVRFLKDREICRATLLDDLGRREENFRTRLVGMEIETSDLRQTNNQQKTALQSKESENQELRRKLTNLEKAMDSLQQKVMVFEHERRELEREIGDKSWKVLQEKLEKDRMRQDYSAKLAMNEQLYNHNIEQTKRKLKEETDARLRSKQQKLDLLRNIINGDSDSGGSVSDTPRARPNPTVNAKMRMYAAQSAGDLYGSDSTPGSTFKVPRHGPVATSAYAMKMGQRGGMRTKSPPPVQPKPMVGKMKRRSRSSDCLWLDHKPEGTVETGSILQPRIKTAKTGAKLSEKDLKDKDTSKYLLTHQSLDSDGEMATQLVKSKESENQELRRKLTNLEKAMDSLQQKVMVFEHERRELEREIGDKSWKVLQEKLEKDRMRQDYSAKLAMNEQLYNHNIEQTKRKLKEETDARLRSKQQKLDLLRNIINGDSDSGGSVSDTPRARPNPTVNAKMRMYAAQSAGDLYGSDSTPGSTFKVPRHGPVATSAYAMKMGQRGGMRTKSPPPVQPKPMVGKMKRRSRSSDCLWLDHKPEGTVETGSILQPRIKTAKTGAKLSEKDLKDKDTSKYLLTHQSLDSDGEMATQLVKGDILQTVGGGAAVVFTDVEVVKQKSPGSRKRLSSPDRKDENSSGEWTGVEARCQVTIEGHPNPYYEPVLSNLFDITGHRNNYS